MARPIVMTEEKIKQLKAICRLKPTLADTATFLEVSEDTIENYCKSQGMRFSEFREKHMVHTRFMIVRKIIEQCQKGNTKMLIYASKVLLGWKEPDNGDDDDDDSNDKKRIIVQLNIPSNGRDVIKK